MRSLADLSTYPDLAYSELRRQEARLPKVLSAGYRRAYEPLRKPDGSLGVGTRLVNREALALVDAVEMAAGLITFELEWSEAHRVTADLRPLARLPLLIARLRCYLTRLASVLALATGRVVRIRDVTPQRPPGALTPENLPVAVMSLVMAVLCAHATLTAAPPAPPLRHAEVAG